MFSVLLAAVVVLGTFFFAGLVLRRGARLIRAVLGLIGWPLRGLLRAMGLTPKRDERFGD